ncbi:hypothetical protein VPFG_00304 [Vibrio phage nt-1]|uniref:Uncharacterized protein n=1 Tax=Vibrio phage nt-1 TaxID=115992 RepID=R9TGS1_9CAUD|nr:hypothetical protein VPFG_00304 [Vibrio phage nt-1]AGN30303.1 hypothetical protein VPFG_00304 [Vibrio phage nt-1]
MLEKLNEFVKSKPLVSIAIAVALGVVGTKVIQADPLAEKPLTKYRIIYEHTTEYGRTCADDKGYFWFAQELDEGLLFDSWEPMGWCGDTETAARNNAEAAIKKRIETANSKKRIYQAWATKEDSVRFEPLKVIE